MPGPEHNCTLMISSWTINIRFRFKFIALAFACAFVFAFVFVDAFEFAFATCKTGLSHIFWVILAPLCHSNNNNNSKCFQQQLFVLPHATPQRVAQRAMRGRGGVPGTNCVWSWIAALRRLQVAPQSAARQANCQPNRILSRLSEAKCVSSLSLSLSLSYSYGRFRLGV